MQVLTHPSLNEFRFLSIPFLVQEDRASTKKNLSLFDYYYYYLSNLRPWRCLHLIPLSLHPPPSFLKKPQPLGGGFIRGRQIAGAGESVIYRVEKDS